MSIPNRKVRGISVPSIFYGTAWKEDRTAALTARALAAGFRAIDTANQRKHYVESSVGDAIYAARQQTGGLRRAELFLQSKFTHPREQDHRLPYEASAPTTEQVAQSFQSTLKHLHTDYLDSYLLHSPISGAGLAEADWDAWKAIIALQKAGRVRMIGISNVSLAQLELLLKSGLEKPAFIQNRCFARLGWDRDIREYCRANDILYQGYGLLTANSREIVRPQISRILLRTGATPAQLVYRYAMQIGIIPLTGTSDSIHMSEDLDCMKITLTADDFAAVDRVGAE